ncbi:MAG TPA: TonB-dependent receptor [Candidatus Angelobacter sp.]|nr:TonB-dependent receptor [Candidatus Angelobacter sp.]
MRHSKIYGGLLLMLVAGLCAQSTPPAAPTQQVQPAGSPTQPVQTAQASSSSSQPAVQPVQPPAIQSAASSSRTVTAPYGEITGFVKSGNVPLPGVTVSAANTITGKKYLTSTDVDGSFKITVTGKGRYVIKAEFSAFAPVTQEVLINDENRNGKTELAMVLLSRAEQEAQQEQRQQMAQQLGNVGRNGGGMQQLALSGAGGGDSGGMGGGNTDAASLTSAGLPNAGLAAEGGNESVAISGAQGRAEDNMFDPGEMQDRMADMRQELALQGGAGNIMMVGRGGFGGGGFGGGGPMIIMMGGGGGRGFRNFNANKPHGSIFYSYDGSGLDAKPYSLNGQPENKASYNQNRFGATIGGPLNIPHIYNGGTKTFLFGNYSGSRSTNPYDVFSTVPTAAERAGDFSGQPVQLVDPVTHTPLANNQITNLNPSAAQLLAFIPSPNLPGTIRNFHFVSASPSNSDTGFVRFNHNFGAQQPGMFGMGRGGRSRRQQQQQNQKKEDEHWSQSINGMFIFNDVRSSVLNPFPGLGGKQSVHNYNFNFGHTATKGLFLNSLHFSYNRSAVNTVNSFTNRTNIESQLGINGVSQRPEDFGLPNLNFAPQFSSLQDITPVFRTTQNISISDSMSQSHGKHSFTWGGDFRHQLVDASNASNARGTFIFSGAATGLPFADFLLGLAQETSLQSGAIDYRFRANTFDLFVQDNWRAGKNLTFNLGVRYEYVTPYTELNNQLVNLDVAPDFSKVAPVLPRQVGPVTGKKFPDGLINADHNNFAPRLGLAWKPRPKTVVRAGYGVNYNISQYGQMATQLGFQPPFAVAQNNPAPTGSFLTLQNGFPAAIASSPLHITNTYAVDPDYRLPYVQTWNLNIQQEIKNSVVVNIGYTGAKGTHLDIVRAPDQLPSGGPRFTACTPTTPADVQCVQPFLFESSEGSSILHQGMLRVRKRLRHGLSVGGTYVYSKSIDDASSIDGGASVVAQNDLDIAAERSLSSFDQRHRFTTDYLYELPFGKDKKWLSKGGPAQNILGGFLFSGNVTLASGLPFSPQIFGRGVDLGRGVTGSARPDLATGQSIQLSDPTIQEWFNTAAFTAPANVFGTAGRNSIIGPGTVQVDMSVSKNIQIKEMQALEVRLSATNVFNTVHFTSIDATFGSPTFGQVVGAGAMRKAQITARYRF